MSRVPKHPKTHRQGYYRRRRRAVRILLTVIALSMALLFLTPIVLTITNSFMTQERDHRQLRRGVRQCQCRGSERQQQSGGDQLYFRAR